ncbi:Predicted acetyltransferase, GNAT family [Streptomyces sp. DI166]|uniref:GNAT family N-acetyltransferase n=1 Tax=Streptomyces sp. DI166 TaxID=1839783 RepID=UPI0007F42EF8|nr:GNAT family N-acetyltransferase [Streptomyces sp. DI166]SBT93852.1 Predicted acetyltransferase, GNAT family [Streptomyces sp. DI166]
MAAGGWQLTENIDHFLARGGDFLRSRPALHTMPLTVVEKLRSEGTAQFGGGAALFGWLEEGGEVRGVFYRLPSRGVCPTPLSADRADRLAARLSDAGQTLPFVSGERATATAFAEAWQRHTGAAAKLTTHIRLYRLGALTPPERPPSGRVSRRRDHGQVVNWCRRFCVEVGEQPSIGLIDAGRWAESRFADRHFTFWESPDGTPVSMAAVTGMVAGMVRVDPVYTPAHLRGRGYAGAVAVEVSRAALDAGATDVVLFADPGNPTSNALYRRIGYEHIADWAVYEFTEDVSSAGRP